MGRLGKIASLPQHLREELNVRLDDNEQGPDLLAWLNALPEAQAMLKLPKFGSAPINEQNLTNWRQGGYARWQQHQRELDFARSLAEESAGFESVAGDVPLADRLAEHSVMALARQLRAAEAMPDGPEKVQTILGVTHELSLLRRCNQGGQWLRMKTEDRAAEREKNREDEVRALVEKEMGPADHEYLETLQDFKNGKAQILREKEQMQAEGVPVPKAITDYLATYRDSVREITAWRMEAARAAWSRTITMCSLDSVMRLIHSRLKEKAPEVCHELDDYVRLPEAERHAELRHNLGKTPETPADPSADQGKSS